MDLDCGFGLWCTQRLRLKGIDAPEISTLKGQEVKNWVQKILEPCAFIIIRTEKSDKYDRYLADVFYLSKESDIYKVTEEGAYLNDELVQQGMAKVWR